MEAPPEEVVEFNQALETVSGIMHTLSEHTIDIPDAPGHEIARIFRLWSRHILRGEEHPLTQEEEEERDWQGLRSYVRQHRKKESEHVGRSMSELRSLIWTFVDRMAKNLSGEVKLARDTQQQMNQLKAAVETNEIDAIKTAALSTVTFLEQALENQNRRRSSEINLLSRRVQALRGELEEARQESETDALTGLANRRCFDLQLERASLMAVLVEQRPSLLMIDIDHFKKVNDQHGHQAGDKVLQAVAGCLARSFPRKMDCVARFGGEEFAVLLVESDQKNATRLGRRFLESLRRVVVDPEGAAIKVTASVGVAELAGDEEASAWVERTDAALYAAKRRGRNRVVPAGHVG